MKSLKDFSLDCQKITNKELNEIEMAVFIIKMLRYLDRPMFNAVIEGEAFKKEVLNPLEQLFGWNEENEKAARDTAEKLKNEISGKTLAEKSALIKEILTVKGGLSGFIAGEELLIKKKEKIGAE